MVKIVKCDCGFVVRSDNDDKLVADLQKHARAQPDTGGSGAGTKRKT